MDEGDKIGTCQWRYALVDGVKTDILGATKGVPGICPLCGEELRPRQGEQRGWHWYHKNGRKCDDWYEPKGEWHKWWQDKFNAEQQEVPIRKEIDGKEKKHIADVLTDENVVIEFQYSHLSDAQIKEREEFYGNMVWVVNGTRLEADKRYGDLIAVDERFNSADGGLDRYATYDDAIIHKTWWKSSKLVFWDFDGTFDEPKEDGYLYCVVNGKAMDGSVVVVRVEKASFIESGKSGRLGELIRQISACKEQYDEEVREEVAKREREKKEKEENNKRRIQEEYNRKYEQNKQMLLEAWKDELTQPAKFAIDCGWVEAILIIRRLVSVLELKEGDFPSEAFRNEMPNGDLMALHLKKEYAKEEYEREYSIAKGKWRLIELPEYEDLRKCAGCIVGKFEYEMNFVGEGRCNSLKVKNISPLHNYDNKVRFVWHVADRNGIWPLTEELIRAVNDRKYKQTKRPKCPVCGSKMVIRARKADGTKFLGCANFPHCKEKFSWDENGIACSESSRLYWRYLVGRSIL